MNDSNLSKVRFFFQTAQHYTNNETLLKAQTKSWLQIFAKASRAHRGKTTNLFNYLKRKHPKECAEHEITQGASVNRMAVRNSTEINTCMKCLKDITDLVMFYLSRCKILFIQLQTFPKKSKRVLLLVTKSEI